jgi:hypothetical protein
VVLRILHLRIIVGAEASVHSALNVPTTVFLYLVHGRQFFENLLWSHALADDIASAIVVILTEKINLIDVT